MVNIEKWLKKSLLRGILRFLPLALLASLADAGLLWGIRSFMQLLTGESPFALWEWATIMFLLAALRLVFMVTKTRSSETFLYTTGKRVTDWFLGALRELSPRLFHDGSGDAKVETAYESIQVLQANGSVFFQAIQAGLQLLIFFPVLIYISWPLTAFLFAAVVPLVAFIQRKLHALGPEEEAILKGRSGFRLDLNTARRLYRNWSGRREREAVGKHLLGENDLLKRAELAASVRKNGLSVVMETVSVLSMVAVLTFCALLIARGWMDATGLVMYCSALLLSYKPVKECTRVLPQFRSAMSAYRMLVEFEKLPRKGNTSAGGEMYGSRTLRVQDDGGEGGPSLGAGTECAGLEIKNANFTYEGSDTPVFRDFNITLSETKPVLLRGKNGIGKSTLLRLLAGLEEWEAATRDAINGASPEINCAGPASVFFIPQDLELPPRRLLTDLLESHEGEPARLIEEFAEVAGTEPLLKKTGLSGGERSRIALLWALASDDTTVLLDEPMAAIALADREKILLKFLDVAARQGKRVIMSSHDPFSAAAEAMFDIVEMERAKG